MDDEGQNAELYPIAVLIDELKVCDTISTRLQWPVREYGSRPYMADHYDSTTMSSYD